MIGEREIHIWIVRTDGSHDALYALLDDEERARVARFRFEDDQRRAIVARGTLRRLLGDALHREPRDLRFVLGPQGKPALAEDALEFNVSHSGAFVAIALAHGSPVGVDVECAKRTSDILAIAERFFAPVEVERVRTADDTAAAFYATWTAKESVIKAVGGGLSIDLKSFRVSPQHEQFTAVEHRRGNEKLAGWYVRALPAPDDDYHAAVAIRGSDWTTIVHPA